MTLLSSYYSRLHIEPPAVTVSPLFKLPNIKDAPQESDPDTVAEKAELASLAPPIGTVGSNAFTPYYSRLHIESSSQTAIQMFKPPSAGNNPDKVADQDANSTDSSELNWKDLLIASSADRRVAVLQQRIKSYTDMQNSADTNSIAGKDKSDTHQRLETQIQSMNREITDLKWGGGREGELRRQHSDRMQLELEQLAKEQTNLKDSQLSPFDKAYKQQDLQHQIQTLVHALNLLHVGDDPEGRQQLQYFEHLQRQLRELKDEEANLNNSHLSVFDKARRHADLQPQIELISKKLSQLRGNTAASGAGTLTPASRGTPGDDGHTVTSGDETPNQQQNQAEMLKQKQIQHERSKAALDRAIKAVKKAQLQTSLNAHGIHRF